jgi:hypothetical protein
MFDYSEIAETANEIIEEFGQAVTLTHVIPGAYDPTTGGVTNTTTTQTGTGAVVDWAARQIDGTLIKVGDRRLLLSAFKTDGAALTAPVLGDTVSIGGVVYTLVEPLKTVGPAGITVIYECNLRF